MADKILSVAPLERLNRQHAVQLDAEDPLRHLRAEFIIPTKTDLKSKTLSGPSKAPDACEASNPECLSAASNSNNGDEPCTYLCGNSLGLQPRRTSKRITSHLTAWAKKGVHGHFFEHEDSPVAPFLPMDNQAAKLMAPIVGALPDEVAIMEDVDSESTPNNGELLPAYKRETQDCIGGQSIPK